MKSPCNVFSIEFHSISNLYFISNELVSFLSDACTLSTDDYVLGDREYRRKYLEGGNPLKKYNQRVIEKKIINFVLIYISF